MAREVRFTQRSVADLEAIWLYIARDSPNHATLVTASIVAAAEELSDYPLTGQRIEQVTRAEVREIPIYPYRLFYKVDEDAIWVLAIAHGARNLNQDFFKRLR